MIPLGFVLIHHDVFFNALQLFSLHIQYISVGFSDKVFNEIVLFILISLSFDLVPSRFFIFLDANIVQMSILPCDTFML